MKPPVLALKNTAVKAALAAGKILTKHFRKKLIIKEKSRANLVSNADLEAEKAVIKILKKAFPQIGILAEESGTSESNPKAAEARWLIDPLDGTTNYIRGFPMFCVSIGLEWQGEMWVGVIYHPILKELFVATKGGGATCNGKKIHVAKTRTLSDGLLTTGFSYNKEKGLHQEVSAFESVSHHALAVRRPGSAALDLAYTARGIFDGYWEKNLSPWDIAAGSLLVQEAGGIVTRFSGKPFDVNGNQILASNKALHPELKSLLERFGV
jgi:myo-inositol-1(or 4)-monophosphatase